MATAVKSKIVFFSYMTLKLFLKPDKLFLGQSEDIKVVCYYQDWSVYYKTKYTFTPKNIDAKLCTHLIYAFARFANDSISLEPFDSYQAIDNSKCGNMCHYVFIFYIKFCYRMFKLKINSNVS